MLKVTPFKISQRKIENQTNGGQKKYSSPTFSSVVISNPIKDEINIVSKIRIAPPWVSDPTIVNALSELNNLTFDEIDIKHLQSIGIVLPFKSGKEAVQFINKSNARIKFDPLSSNHIHAQYDFENNFIKINEIYKNTQNPAEILAIASAIFHEAGHAKDGDGISSVQEELDCLSLNSLAHRAFLKKYPDIFKSTDALIVKDGVSIYADLFFDNDSSKLGLINRVRQKYGFLPAGDFMHSPSNLAFKVKNP